MNKTIHPSNEEAFYNLNPEQREWYMANRQQVDTVLGDESTPVKFDQGKVDWAILPLDAVEEIIKVFQFGEQKYARGNFANGDGLEYTRMLNSLMRHTTSFMRGEDNDPESGLSHMGHAGCCVLMLLHFITHKDQFPNNDDRAGKIL
jgi:hypothetical protein